MKLFARQMLGVKPYVLTSLDSIYATTKDGQMSKLISPENRQLVSSQRVPITNTSTDDRIYPEYITITVPPLPGQP